MDYVLQSDIADRIDTLVPGDVDTSSIYSVHSRDYLDSAREIAASGGGYLDGDTYTSADSFEAALETASAAVAAADSIITGEFKRIFLAGRPPGHHAEYDRGMGFCIINNAAVAAEHLIMNHDLKRVAIVDWDVHHGSGTQHAFYNRGDVYFVSLHQYPFYPGSGAEAERGEGEGNGYTLNIPLPGGCGDEKYLDEFEKKVISGLTRFDPEFIIISCGFDAHRDDPLGGMNVTERAFGEMTAMLVELAEKCCDGKILSVLEGGYNGAANSRCLFNHLKEMQSD